MPCNVQQKEPCLLPWTHLYYHTDKKVYPCCKLVEHPHFEVGNTTDSLEELWNSPLMKFMRLSIKKGTEPEECWKYCYNSINPLHVHVPNEFKTTQKDFFDATLPDGSYPENFIFWNVNESNICNFACVYCCSSFSTKFEGELKRSFPSLVEQIKFFKENATKLKMIFLSAGESHLQPGYYEMLEYLIENKLTNIRVVVHTNLSGYKLGKKNFYELLNQFSDVTLFASLDSFGERAEFIRHGTKWIEIEQNRKTLQEYTNIKFVAQSVITNLNIWSLPDFHYDWYAKGFLDKHNIRYFSLQSPEYLHMSVMKNEMKQKVKNKLQQYLDFLQDVSDTTYNFATPAFKIQQIIDTMKEPPITSISRLNFFVVKHAFKMKTTFNKVFPEFIL